MAPMQGGGTNNYGWAFFVMHQMITMYTKSLHISSAMKYLLKIAIQRKNQNLTIVGQNLTGMTYLQFFGHSASLQGKIILETNKTSFASYSLIQ